MRRMCMLQHSDKRVAKQIVIAGYQYPHTAPHFIVEQGPRAAAFHSLIVGETSSSQCYSRGAPILRSASCVARLGSADHSIAFLRSWCRRSGATVLHERALFFHRFLMRPENGGRFTSSVRLAPRIPTTVPVKESSCAHTSAPSQASASQNLRQRKKL